MPLNSVAKFADGWGFNSVSVCSWAEGPISAPESFTNCEWLSFSSNTNRNFWKLFKTSQENFSLISRFNLGGS